jgi:hypothetical protein
VVNSACAWPETGARRVGSLAPADGAVGGGEVLRAAGGAVAVLKGAHEHGLAKGSAGRSGHDGYGGGQDRTTAGRGGTAARIPRRSRRSRHLGAWETWGTREGPWERAVRGPDAEARTAGVGRRGGGAPARA